MPRTPFLGDRHAGIFMGPERAANMSPAKWAQDAGVRFSSHMDTPVTPMRPLQAVWSPVERKTKTGVYWVLTTYRPHVRSESGNH